MKNDDLISRAAILDVLVTSPNFHTTLTRIEELPAVDAVPVVRCRDCKYGESEANGEGEDVVLCNNKHNPVGFDYWLMPPEWFCADGERREPDA